MHVAGWISLMLTRGVCVCDLLLRPPTACVLACWCVRSVPVTVDLDEYLDLDFRLSSMVEMTLSANLRKATAEQARLKWRVANDTAAPVAAAAAAMAGGGGAASSSSSARVGANSVTLKPREIRTFLLNAQPVDAAQ
jgi:L-lactate utilization protein LutB